ncbi:excinuclease ABC subunit UvrA [Clostridium gasigenes]|uniref:excinuclease ABC subunit UvrA n=1 Tax=Clostridium gasigenes TaxID=94869 RepID=UPI0014384FC1|nr:excinuclease ABC subunit UvrA [Clostridium gasigenes]MBU3104399.1 excinuclease ABC subunit UvrA [Clostridium gasigenes]NKF06713.1 excinuclease ABC subunit UvrA [Clostridium gasigenes]QSW20939.1 excinuclease ABC subunit UvrA [Clostridium gasigenes]
MKDKIIIKGAKVHNLKNVSLEIPRDKLIVFTGLSGSGKSSLAFDTLYAEGQRRYVESLSSYARQFLGQIDKPDVESIEGLSPAISIDQKTTSKNPRSTVGTVTEIYDYLRLLYAKVGVPYCPKCKVKITQQSVDQIVDGVMLLGDKIKIQILAPIISGKKGVHEKVLENIKKNGFIRARIDGEIYDLTEEEINLDKNIKHSIEAVVDRIVIKEGIEGRLSDSVETALKLSEGLVLINIIGGEDILFSEKFACRECGMSIDELAPRLFSFNSPFGKCDYCDGLGALIEIDENLVIPNKDLSIMEGAIATWGEGRLKDDSWTLAILKAMSKEFKLNLKKPIKSLKPEEVDLLLYGTKGHKLTVNYTKEGMTAKYSYAYEGEINALKRRYRETNSDVIKGDIEQYMSNNHCPKCKGARLRKEALAVMVGDKNIYEFTKMPIRDELEFLNSVEFSEKDKIISDQIVKEINSRLNFLLNVGLDYLNLSRTAGTLSGGESQRIRLATQIGSALMGVLYILDEPSIGLHQRDNDRLIETLKNLRDVGNTVIVVEHDEDTIREADFIVDIGPRAGEHGGEIVASGTLEDIKMCKESITGQYLIGEKKINCPSERRKGNGNKIVIQGAKENNLKNINVTFPLGILTMVTGVSGSGKSTLINEILYKGLNRIVNKSKNPVGSHKDITGSENIDKIIDIDQGPIGRTPRSNPATYTGTFDIIRELFSQTNEAKMRGYKPGRFSFNVKGGRCEACTGDGIIKIEMQFLSDVYVPCEVCKGKRYNRETLEVKYKGKSIHDILNMTVEEGLTFFENMPRIKNKMQTLFDVGLGYIRLGQPSTQLSGGEAQRIKLASELSKRSTGKTLYILDEPTTGLHIDDVNRLVEILQRLVNAGNTVVVIEHNLDMIKCADYIVDLGPEGGDKGGSLVVCGTPETVCKNKESYTGKYLNKILQ